MEKKVETTMLGLSRDHKGFWVLGCRLLTPENPKAPNVLGFGV